MHKQVVDGNRIEKKITYIDPSARFALPGERSDGVQCAWPIGQEMLSRHMLLLGGIGTGKSNAFYHLIRQLRYERNTNDIIFIFDTKGDYYEKFYQPGDVVISNDARATGSSHVDYWNIFNEITADDQFDENALEICTSLFEEKIEHTTQPFFPNAARDLLRALLLHLLRNKSQHEKCNNQDLRDILNSFDSEAMCRILRQHKDFQAMQAYIKDPSSGQTLGVVSELLQVIQEIFIGNFAKRGTLSMRKLVRAKGGRVVFIEYDLSIGSVLQPIYRILFDLAIKEALSRNANEGSVYFILDEFRLLPHLKHIDDGINFGRSLGAKFIIGVQNVEQLNAAYGAELAASLLSGLSTLICFRLNDSQSRRYVTENLGRNLTSYALMSSVQNKGVIDELRETNVAEDWDITRLRPGEAIIRYAEYAPFLFRFALYRK